MITQVVAYATQTVLGDSFLLYRLYVVWGKNIWIALPFILSILGQAASGIGGIRTAALATGTTAIFITQLQTWVLVFLIMTLITNFCCTSLIAGRIWWVHRKSRSLGRTSGPGLAAPMTLIIESGAIYSVCMLFQIALYSTGSFGYNIVLDATPSIIGITFTLLIVRVGLGLSDYGGKSQSSPRGSSLGNFTSTLTGSNFGGNSARPQPSMTSTCQCGQSMTMRPIQVQISRATDGYSDGTGPASFSQGDKNSTFDELVGNENNV